MQVFSVDLEWADNPQLAVAETDDTGIIRADHNYSSLADLEHRLAASSQSDIVVLLDIPLDPATDSSYRRVDKALQKCSLPPLPSSNANTHGAEYRQILLTATRGISGIRVYEIYPYAIYKFLWWVETYQKPSQLLQFRRDTLIDERFLNEWPKRYKRAPTAECRAKARLYLYDLLMHRDLGLVYEPELPHPDNARGKNRLSTKHVLDIYDACLGAVLGVLLARRSPYVALAGAPGQGQMLLLADRWLTDRLKEHVDVTRPS